MTTAPEPPPELSSETILDALQSIARELNDADDLDQVLRLILSRGVELLAATCADLYIVEKRTGNLRRVRTTRVGEARENGRVLQRGEGLCGWVAACGRTAIVGNVRHDNRYTSVDESITSELAIPLKIDKEVIGVLNFEDSRENAFSRLQEKLLEGLAVYASVALQRLRERDLLESLQEIDQAILDSGLDREQTLGVLLKEGVDLLEPIKCHIAIYHPEDDTLEIVAARPEDAVGRRIPLDECVSGRAVRSGELEHVPDVKKDDRYHDTGQPELPIESEIVAPLKDADGVLGVFNVENAYKFSRTDFRFLETLAHQAAISLKTADLVAEQKRQNRELEALRRIDEAILDPSRDLEETLQVILKEGLDLLECPSGYLLLREENRLRIKAQAGGDGEGRDLLRSGGGICDLVAQAGEPRLVVDVLEEPGNACASGSIRSELAYPLKDEGRLLGIVYARSPEVGFFERGHVRLLDRFANQVVVAIKNAELQQIILELGEIIAGINSASDVFATLQKILDSTLRLLKVASGMILVGDEATGELVVRVARGRERGALREDAVAGAPILGEVVETGKPIIVRGESMWGARDGSECGILAAPLVAHGRTIGAIYLESQEASFFSGRHKMLIELLAGGAAIALENSKTQQSARRSAVWDGIKDYNHDLLHWVVNKATPMRGGAERLKADLGSVLERLEPMLGSLEAVESIAEDLQIILTNAADLVEVQRKFRDISQELEIVPFQVEAVIQKSIASQVGTHSFVELGIEDALPEIAADASQTEMILDNFLKNALEAMSEVEDKLLRIAARKNRRGDRVLVSIADNGHGIEPEHLERIWDPLFTTRSEGTGIGLAVSYEVLKRMSCTVDVESRPGEGTEFLLSFPISTAAEPAAAGVGRSRARAARGSARLHP